MYPAVEKIHKKKQESGSNGKRSSRPTLAPEVRHEEEEADVMKVDREEDFRIMRHFVVDFIERSSTPVL
jgi:hypothetical protein